MTNKNSFIYKGIPICFDRDLLFNDLFTLSVSFSIGSKNETSDNRGVTHLIEHLLFKGSKRFDKFTISNRIEKLGGYINAFTSKELTSFYVSGNSKDIYTILDILLDAIFNPIFLEEEFIKEKKVVINELREDEDDPEIILSERAESLFFGSHSLSFPIGGTVESINHITLDSVKDFYKQNFIPKNCLISIAGDISSEKVIDALDRVYTNTGINIVNQSNFTNSLDKVVVPKRFQESINNDFEQCYGKIMYPLFSCTDDNRTILSSIAFLLGGGFSSRLFQKIREEHALAYSISANTNLYIDGGYLDIDYVCSMENYLKLEELILSEVASFALNKLKQDDLEMVKNRFLYNIKVESLSMENRVFENSFEYLSRKRLINVEEEILKVNSITEDSLLAQAEKYLDKDQGSICRIVNIKS